MSKDKMNKEEAKQKVRELAQRFRYNLDVYKKSAYNETQVRREFIDPFFEALGWDVENKQGHAEQYKDVVHEDAIKVGSSTRAPDYSFRIGGQRKFFVEAKKPAVNIKEDVSPSYQLRRYAWSAKLPLSIVTDFEELSVYDCRVKPGPKDKASVARIGYYTFEEYLDKFDEIYDVFSKDAILKGSFDRHAQSTKGKRGTAEVDSEFLKEIESWREMLAKNIALRNPDVSIYELNYAVQKIIDRVIFLRICEDRGIEPDGRLQLAVKSTGIYKHLLNQFRSAESNYNSGIFNFKVDAVTPRLKIDDKVIKAIIESLYYPLSPYEFSVLGVEILGNVYEQFLGKVIRLTAGHQAKVETKPEVKKAGGVYYTPQHIVDYIVRNTVGKLVTGKAPGEIAEIKILDPACGSGSFLIGAYTYLLKYHLNWYVENKPKRHKEAVFQVRENEWYLTTAEKKRILLSNIFGVDIDSQAVEVTKLSLQLKVLENESRESVDQQVKLGMEGILPNLGGNIKCGNSLIGSDFYDTGQMRLFDEDEMRRVNVFDWEDGVKGFGEILKKGGFDCVIGNPPYGFHQIHSKSVKMYFKKHFVASQGSFEHYFLFSEKSLRLLKRNGVHGFIVPVTWLTIPSARSLRKFILDDYWIKEISWLPELVFTNAQVNTLISIIQNAPANNVKVKIYNSLGFREAPREERAYKQSQFIHYDYFIGIFEKKADNEILQKIDASSQPLKEIARPCSGYNPYEVGKGQTTRGGPQTKDTVKTKPYHSEEKLSDEWKPEIVGRNMGRYFLNITGKRWIKYGPWLAAPRDPKNFFGKRILVQEITGGKDRRIVATYYDGELYHSRDVIPIKIENDLPDPSYLLGIINSWLITWYHHKRSPKAQKGLFPKVLVSDLKNLPIRSIDFSNPVEKIQHDKLVALVDKMLELQKKYHEARMERDKELYERQIKIVDAQIDGLVYDLYGLTEEEVKVVEGC
ncbi:MAG: N-6 DNA Methylase [Candidatus Argoarchaeum ethanivorans]|uniref:site-specific DNA-methyltransferase (adenine-specific) n=1 Tax=Candidatus Argoarchaeum ethanivorans TaxID=2608793 RepID=A0A811T2G0_9EURY|nr:MAG: N-6 DNA Methylase [Candidatus Argoarchaeum ethanivorans]